MNEKQEYFYCFIGPFDRNKLDEIRPNGEGSLRYAVQQAYRKLTGEAEDSCCSGWGVTEERREDAGFWLYNDETKDAIIRSYFDEKKPFYSRAQKAYYLLRKSEGKIFRE